MMIPGDSIPDYMHISLKGKRALYKSELMLSVGIIFRSSFLLRIQYFSMFLSS